MLWALHGPCLTWESTESARTSWNHLQMKSTNQLSSCTIMPCTQLANMLVRRRPFKLERKSKVPQALMQQLGVSTENLPWLRPNSSHFMKRERLMPSTYISMESYLKKRTRKKRQKLYSLNAFPAYLICGLHGSSWVPWSLRVMIREKYLPLWSVAL